MSNFLSQPFEVVNPQSSINQPLIEKVLSVRQGRYDANKAKVDQTLAIYQNQLRGLRDEDNQYISARLQEAKALMDNYGNRDFSLSTTTDTLLSSLKSVTEDPIIQSAVINKRIYDEYNLQADEVRKKNQDLYSDLNYQYGLKQSGYREYLDGKVKNLNKVNYINAYDESKEFKEFSENLDKYADDIEKSVNGNDGYIYTQKGKRLTEGDIRSRIDSLLSDKAKQQMKINAWGTYEQQGVAGTLEAFSKYKQTELGNLDIQLNDAELQFKNGQITKGQLDNFKLQAKQVTDTYSEWEKNPEKNQTAMSFKMYKDRSIGGFAKAFAFDNVSETVSSDATFLKKTEHEWNKYIDSQKLIIEAHKEGLSLDKDGKVIAGAGSGAIVTKVDPNYKPDAPTQVLDDYEKTVSSYDGLIKTTAQGVLDSLDTETQNQINKKVEASKGKKSLADVLVEMGDTSKQIVSSQGYKALSDYRLEQGIQQQALLKYQKQAEKEQEFRLQGKDVVQELYDNPNVKIMWTDVNGKESLMSGRKILEAQKGMIDGNGKATRGLDTTPAILNAIKKSMYAESRNSYDWKKLAPLLGEDPNKIFTNNVINYDKYSDESIKIERIDPNSKTWKFIEAQRKQGGYDRPDGFGGQNSLSELDTVNGYKKKVNDPTKIRTRVAELLQKDTTLSIGKIITVATKTSDFKNLKDLLSQGVDDNVSFSISPKVGDPSMVRVTQNTQVKSQGKVTNTITTDEDMRIEDLPASIRENIDFSRKKNLITIQTIPDVKQAVNYGDTKTNSDLKTKSEAFFNGNVELAKMTTKKGASQALFRVNPQLTGTENEPTQLGLLVKAVLQDKQFSVGLKKGTSNDAYMTIYHGGEEVEVFDRWYTDHNIKQGYEMAKYTPELVINEWLQALILNNDKDGQLRAIYGK